MSNSPIDSLNPCPTLVEDGELSLPVFKCLLNGQIERVDNATYLVGQSGRWRITSKGHFWPEGIWQWSVVPTTSSTGEIGTVEIISAVQPQPGKEFCTLVGRVVQLGKKNGTVLLKITRSGQKILKITLLGAVPQMKIGEVWQISAKLQDSCFQIESAFPQDEKAELFPEMPPPVAVKNPQVAPVSPQNLTDAAVKRRVLAQGVVQETFEQTAQRLVPIAQQALSEVTGESEWVLQQPVERDRCWEWEANKSINELQLRARVRVNSSTLVTQVYQYTSGHHRLPGDNSDNASSLLLDTDFDNEDPISQLSPSSQTWQTNLQSQIEVEQEDNPKSKIQNPKSHDRLVVTPLGAARSIGASCFKVEIGPYEIVLDAGTRPKGNNPLPALDYLENPDLMLVTHAHQDHIGALPVFHREFPGTPMICTPGTREIAHVMLTDGLKVQQSSEDFQELFDEIDLEQTLFRLETQPVGLDFEPLPGLKVRFIHAGHIVGAACIYLRYGERSLFYTGDYNTTNSRTTDGLRLADLPEADILITESTYGASTHPSRKAQETELLKAVAEVVLAGGNVLIPAFALGRAQEILLAIRTSELFHKLKIPVYVDGLVRAVTDVFIDHLELLPPGVQNFAKQQEPFFAPNGTPPIIPIGNKRERPLAIAKPSVVIASSGMLSGGASVYYGQVLLERENAAVFISGYTDEESPGRFLQGLQKGDTIELEGKELTVNATVRRFNLSAHADKVGLTQVIHRVNPKHLILIHGSTDALNELAQTGDLKDKYIVHIPAVGEAVEYGAVPDHISATQVAKLTLPAEFEVEVAAEVEGAWIRIPQSVVESDPRWQILAANGLLKAKWNGIALKLTPVTQRDLALEAVLAKRGAAAHFASGEDCCAVCQFFKGGYCQGESSPLFQLQVDPQGKCLEFIQDEKFAPLINSQEEDEETDFDD
ncbi:MAG: MBL fold metallo-hydrolase [Aphanothece sp. CMT-3BRIN-NPC111]|jgi:Cft2 family RNA processing exonuclease|nr:MBL fold metallo-hydrolase [Aphanothece sp. CMT-3BRIN-NPC111]